MDRGRLSRRGLLKGLSAVAGAAAGTRIAGVSRWIGDARAASEPASVVMIHFDGGYQAFYGSADTMVGQFGVTATNFTKLTGGLAVDDSMATGLSAFAKTHMAVIGVNHGKNNHDGAQPALWTHAGNNAGLILASAIGGTASIKAPILGTHHLPNVPTKAYGGVSLQSILDVKSTIDALGAAPNVNDPRVPNRTLALTGMTNAQKMSGGLLASSPDSLATLGDGYTAAIDTLTKAPIAFDAASLMAAYGLGTTTKVQTFASKMAAAEVMVRAGATTLTVIDDEYVRTLDPPTFGGSWDIHHLAGVGHGRTRMSTVIMPALKTFMSRMVEDPTRNVVVCLFGDCNRSLIPLYKGQVIPPGDDNHAPNTTATVIGRYVKQGTNGKVDTNGRLTQTTAGPDGMWAYLAAVARVGGAPFGANPHPFVL